MKEIELMQYEMNTRVSYYHVDPKGFLSMPALLFALQEAALDHCKLGGHDVVSLKDRALGWAVISWHIEIDRLPKLWDNIRIETWTNRHGRMQIQRNYVIYENDVVIMRVVSQWILLDLNERAIKEPIEEFLKYCTDREGVLPKERFFVVTKKSELGELVSTRHEEVRRSDVDTNGHVNNVKYLEWAMNDIPDDVYENLQVSRLKIAYKRECNKGDRVVINTYRSESHITSYIDDDFGKRLVEISYDFDV